MLLSLASIFTVPRPAGIRTFVASIILRMIFSIGPSPTIWLLGFLTVILKGIHIVSLMGNHGTLEKQLLKIVTDAQLIYHFGYMVFCMTGMLVHPFFYSVLVRAFDIFNETRKLITISHLQLFDVVYREETLLNVIRSVTRNGRSIIFTAVLALILVYLFSIIGYIFFKDDFLVPVDDELVAISGDHGLPCNDPPDVTLSKSVSDSEQQVCSRETVQESDDGGGERKERACDSLVMCIITTLNQGLRNGGGIGDILRAPSSSVSIVYFFRKFKAQISKKDFSIFRRHYLWRVSFTICCSSSSSLLLF